jgi:outer membrane protein
MKKLLASGIALALFGSGAAFAATTTKVGTVDLQRAVTECKEGGAARATLLKKSEALNAELKAMAAEIEKIKTDAPQGSELSADERAEKSRLLQKKVRELQNRQREAQEELKQVESDSLRKLLARLGTLLNKIGEDENYTAILDRNNGVFFAGKKTDLTGELVQRADAEYEKH